MKYSGPLFSEVLATEHPQPVAALFVARGSTYWQAPGVDAWDEERDARRYEGPYPVVAHPPCARWCALAGLVQSQYGYKIGDDGGCFESALRSVRTFGGVLEHPAFSKAWPAYQLPKPDKEGGWVQGSCGGWACHVEQSRYGHPARKATWLYAFGTARPELRWGKGVSKAVVGWCQNKSPSRYPAIVGGVRHEGDTRPRMSPKAASATPLAFREELLALARSV